MCLSFRLPKYLAYGHTHDVEPARCRLQFQIAGHKIMRDHYNFRLLIQMNYVKYFRFYGISIADTRLRQRRACTSNGCIASLLVSLITQCERSCANLRRHKWSTIFNGLECSYIACLLVFVIRLMYTRLQCNALIAIVGTW